MTSDATLLHSWQNGDLGAGNALVRRYYHRVRHFFATKVVDHIDDLTQQTFMACAERRERIVDGGFAPYLFGIARNKLLHRLRHARRHDGRVEGLRSSAADACATSGFAARGQSGRVLLLALRRLPLDAQIALEMFYWEDMTIAEIGVVLALPPGTVKARLSRARMALREHLRRLGGTSASRRTTASGLAMWAVHARAQVG